MQIKRQTTPILLFNDECGVCRSIAHWVKKSAQMGAGGTSMIVRPIGEDPEELKSLNPALSIWDAYSTIHLLMPDGSMKLGGEAVAAVLRNLPGTGWFTWTFSISIVGFRPFQLMLNLAYAILADVRPIFGCESCGEPSPWMRPFKWAVKSMASLFRGIQHPTPRRHFTTLPAKGAPIRPAVSDFMRRI